LSWPTQAGASSAAMNSRTSARNAAHPGASSTGEKQKALIAADDAPRAVCLTSALFLAWRPHCPLGSGVAPVGAVGDGFARRKWRRHQFYGCATNRRSGSVRPFSD
jgi:hypothetical protein